MGSDYESWEMVWDGRMGWRGIDGVDRWVGLSKQAEKGTTALTSHPDVGGRSESCMGPVTTTVRITKKMDKCEWL